MSSDVTLFATRDGIPWAEFYLGGNGVRDAMMDGNKERWCYPRELGSVLECISEKDAIMLLRKYSNDIRQYREDDVPIEFLEKHLGQNQYRYFFIIR